MQEQSAITDIENEKIEDKTPRARKVAAAFIMMGGVFGIDILAEYELVAEKKSKLSRRLRDTIVAVVSEVLDNGQEKFLAMFCTSFALVFYPGIRTQFKEDDKWEDVVSEAVESDDFGMVPNVNYSVSSYLECLALLFAYSKFTGKIPSAGLQQCIFALDEENTKELHTQVGQLLTSL